MIVEEYDLGRLAIGDRFIIGEINEGTNVSIEIVSTIIAVANKHFKGKRWGYISHRVQSFSTDPTVYKQAHELDGSMVAFAAVVYREISQILANVEDTYIGSSFKYASFNKLDDAIDWMKEILSQEQP